MTASAGPGGPVPGAAARVPAPSAAPPNRTLPGAAVPAPRGPAGAPPAPRTPEAGVRLRAVLRAPFHAEPGRLRLAGLVLVVLALLFGAVTVWQIDSRQTAADNVAHRSGRLTVRAADVYWSLADADATAAAGFLIAGQEPSSVRSRYEQDIRNASAGLAAAAENAGSGTRARVQIDVLNRELPVYTGLIETARANNRQGYPVGGAYLRYASSKMTATMLPAAQKLYESQAKQLAADGADARSVPAAAYVLGLLALAAVVRVSLRLYRRTNRVFNPGLLGAGAALLAALAWLLVGQVTSAVALADSAALGSDSVRTLTDARIAGLKARGAEDLTLVARGDGGAYTAEFDSEAKRLGDASSAAGGLLADAVAQADDAAGKDPLLKAERDFTVWMARHRRARAADDGGDYATAQLGTVGYGPGGARSDATTERSFDAMDKQLGKAMQHEKAQFGQLAGKGLNALDGLAVGAAALAVLAAGAAVLGLGRRLAEYR